jgi:hypothetical protein
LLGFSLIAFQGSRWWSILETVTLLLLRPYSKSSLTLKEWRFNPSFLECQCCFWITGGWYIVRYDTIAIQKQHWHSREAQIEPPLCEWAFRIQALRRISSPHTKLLAARCECLHLIKMNCLALWLDESAHALLAASCEELRARTGNPPLHLQFSLRFLVRFSPSDAHIWTSRSVMNVLSMCTSSEHL